MTFEKFFASLPAGGAKVVLDNEISETSHLLNNEALFQLPLICMLVLVMAKDRRKPHVSQIGQLVGECIELSMPGFKGSAQHVGWSANLRVRTVKAISFLELAGLVVVCSRKSTISVSPLGKKVINKALSRDDDLAYSLCVISNTYRNICISRQMDLELE